MRLLSWLLGSILIQGVFCWAVPFRPSSPSRKTTVGSSQLAATTTVAPTTEILADHDAFVIPERDPRQYRVVRLPNNLVALLVTSNSPGVGVEAASVHVQSGHFDDTIAGLAHFHEHMLFLGTEEFPDESEYETFLSKYGGFSNAYTDMEDTNYFFSITTQHPEEGVTEGLHGALERLASFFICPKFDPDAVDREVNAIHSEYVNAKTSDAWRAFQILKSTSNPEHPFAKFGCGNRETLLRRGRDELLSELRRFWETYYVPHNMRLAVVGHGSLDDLEQVVVDTFGKIPYSSGPPRHIRNTADQYFVRENAVYGTTAMERVGVLRRVRPLTERRTLKVSFLTPPLDDPKLQHTKPYRALSHFLGHEAPGSLHHYLNQQGLILSLTSGVAQDTSDFSMFGITLALTSRGMAEYERVLDLVFQWIQLLKSQSPEQLEGYHEELRQIAAMNFRFRENSDPTDFCTSAASLLFQEDLDPARILVTSSETTAYNRQVEQMYLDRFRPSNALITLTSSDLEVTDEWETEPLYGGQYLDETIQEKQLDAWENPAVIDEHLQAPKLNEFIPTDFSLRCDDNDTDVSEVNGREPPELIQNSQQLRMWHKMDRFWKVPKAFIRLALESPATYASPRSMTLNRLFQRVLHDDLNSFVYDASLAGSNYRVVCTPSGYKISVTGYSEKLSFVLDTLTTRILSLIEEMKAGDPVLRDKFEKARDGLLRETKNYRLDNPYEVANYNSRLLLEQSVWYLENYINLMEGKVAEAHPLTMEECALAAEESLTRRVRAEALCFGNIDQVQTKEVARVIETHFLDTSRGVAEVESTEFRSMRLPSMDEAESIFGPGVRERSIPTIYQSLTQSETEENNAVEIVLQTGSEHELGYGGLAILDLIAHMAYNSAFAMLRTQEQLGYIVSAMARKTAGGGWGMSIIVQSSVATPTVLEARCEAWLASFRQELEQMSPENIAREASAVASQYLEVETKMSQEAQRVWTEIVLTEGLPTASRTPEFERMRRVADELTISESNSGSAIQERILSFFDRYFAGPGRRVMSARVYSHQSQEEFDRTKSEPGVLSSYADIRKVKQFLSSMPSAPYWIQKS